MEKIESESLTLMNIRCDYDSRSLFEESVWAICHGGMPRNAFCSRGCLEEWVRAHPELEP